MSELTPETDIVYLATPPGRGGIAAIVVRGPTAVARVAPLVRGRSAQSLADLPEGRLLYGHIVEDGTILDEVLVRVERGAGEGSVEIDCHGGPAACEAIITAICRRGATRCTWEAALEREGDLSPIRREALHRLPQALTVRTAGLLLDQYWGALDRALRAIAERIDNGELEAARVELHRLLATTTVGLHLVDPWRVVVAGRPNVGKSTLVNALVGSTRSIVSPQPGTTRDLVGQDIAIDGWPIHLLDTAGLQTSDDPIDRAAVELARQAAAEADLLLLLIDGSVPLEAQDRELLGTSWPAPVLTLVTKADRPPAWPTASVGAKLSISALRRDGIDPLCRLLSARLVPQPPGAGEPVVFTQRQRDALNVACNCLGLSDTQQALAVMRELVPND